MAQSLDGKHILLHTLFSLIHSFIYILIRQPEENVVERNRNTKGRNYIYLVLLYIVSFTSNILFHFPLPNKLVFIFTLPAQSYQPHEAIPDFLILN